MTTRLIAGDCRAVLATLADESVHCVVTSPPYWGLRSYLPEGHADKHLEIGSEPSLQAWVDTMVEVFREVRRVLRPDGTLWLNLGDSYNAAGRIGHGTRFAPKQGTHRASAAGADNQIRPSMAELKPKDLMGQPWRVAFALQADGWWLRQEVIWQKQNPMPESVRDRCTKSHEHVFLLTKSADYFWNFEAVQEPVNGGANARPPGNQSHSGADAYEAGDEKHRTKAGLVAYAERARAKYRTPAGWAIDGFLHTASAHQVTGRHRKTLPPKTALATSGNDGAYPPDTRNPRSVWTIPTHPFSGAHFATFPPELARRCITAGTSTIGACPHCGAQWRAVSEAAHSAAHDGTTATKFDPTSTAGRLAQLRQAARERGEEYTSRRVVTGAEPGCRCPHNLAVPCTVLDPFAGAGTVGMVADRMQRDAVLIELDARSITLATHRITDDAPLFAQVDDAPPPSELAA